MSKTNYGIDSKTFVTAWETSSSIKEVYEKLRKVSEGLNLPPMPGDIIASRAAQYRQKLPLKKFDRGRPSFIDEDELLELIQQIRGGASPGLEPSAEPEPRPPSNDPTRVAATVRDILASLGR